MDFAAGLQDVGFPLLQVEVEIRQRVVLDVAGGVAELLELGKCRDRGGAARDEARAAAGERLLEARVLEGAVGILLESG